MNKYSFTIGLLILFGCTFKHQVSDALISINIDPNEISHGESKLSDFAESIEYIPLETTDECLIGRIGNFDISEKFIATYCFVANNVYLFHRDGRFINSVGRMGHGPGEYLGPSGAFIDEKRSRIIILDYYKKLQLNYDLDGRFVDSKSIDEGTTIGIYKQLYNDYFFVATRNYNGNVPFAYEIRDMDLQLITENISTVFFERRSTNITGVGVPHHYIYNDKIHAKELTLNDTIYSIEKDFSFNPKFIVNAGRYEVTTDIRAETGERFFELMRSRVLLRNFFETKDRLLAHYHYENKLYYSYYDKKSRKLFYFNSEDGIPNDIDGTVNYWPRRQDNRLWYAFYEAEHFSNTLDNVAPDDNPVLMIVKIKE
jgi:hypothetical protein